MCKAFVVFNSFIISKLFYALGGYIVRFTVVAVEMKKLHCLHEYVVVLSNILHLI